MHLSIKSAVNLWSFLLVVIETATSPVDAFSSTSQQSPPIIAKARNRHRQPHHDFGYRPSLRTYSTNLFVRAAAADGRSTLSATASSNAFTTAESGGEGEDSLDKFAQDLETVLKRLRKDVQDPTIPPLFRRKTNLATFSDIWDLADWDRHTSRKRYIWYLINLPRCRLMIRLLPQLSILFIWSCIAVWLCSKEVGFLHKFSLPLTPLSLVSTFVAALLTLRSNQGLGRLNSGRESFGSVVLYTRELASLVSWTIYPRNKQLALMLLRHLSL